MIAAENSVRDAGYRVVRIVEPGTLDGGDVLEFGGAVYVGTAVAQTRKVSANSRRTSPHWAPRWCRSR